jgi:acyl carrier protein
VDESLKQGHFPFGGHDTGQQHPFRRKNMSLHSEQIRAILVDHARLLVGVDTLTDESDLYEAGLTSLSTVNLMLALEEHFDVEFLDSMLGRKTFSSIRALSEAIEQLAPVPAPLAAIAATRVAP